MNVKSVPLASHISHLALALSLLGATLPATAQSSEDKPAPKPSANLSLYLDNVTNNADANDFQTDLRNMLPHTRIYYVPTASSVTLSGPPEELQLAQKLLADMNHNRKSYRLTYTFTETNAGKPATKQHFSLIILQGGKASLKQGSKVPIVTGFYKEGEPGQNSQVQYLDVGLSIEASIDGYLDGIRLRSKLEQSALAEDKPNAAHDPVVNQSVLETTSVLVPGKPLVLGSIDIPDTSRHQAVEVTSELIH
jgi:type II secretory pathway component GspD/PulD (secretin)